MRATEYFVHACDPKTLIVRQIMEDAVVTVSPASSAMAVAELLSEHNFGTLPKLCSLKSSATTMALDAGLTVTTASSMI